MLTAGAALVRKDHGRDPATTVAATETKRRISCSNDGATVEELVRALQAIGSTARDVIAILQNMRAAGALEAEIEVL